MPPPRYDGQHLVVYYGGRHTVVLQLRYTVEMVLVDEQPLEALQVLLDLLPVNECGQARLDLAWGDLRDSQCCANEREFLIQLRGPFAYPLIFEVPEVQHIGVL